MAFTILGFITAFLFILNFIFMQLYRFEHLGKVCAGDYNASGDQAGYLPTKGLFIHLMIDIIYGMLGLIVLSIICLSLTFKYKQNQLMR